MKSIIALLSISLLIVFAPAQVHAQGGGLCKSTTGYCENFVYADSVPSSQIALFPVFDSKPRTYVVADTVTVNNTSTYIIDSLTGAETLNLIISPTLPAGAELYVQIAGDSIRVLTFGTGFVCPTLSTVANKRKMQHFIYNGTAFVPIAAAYQIN